MPIFHVIHIMMVSIKKNFAYSSLLTAANYVFPLVTYPYVARVIGVDRIGLVNFVESIVNYFVIISMMGMAVLGVREVAAAAGHKARLSRRFGALLTLNTITTAIALAIYAVACVCVAELREHAHLMAFGAMKILFSALLVDWLYRGLEDFRYITLRTVAVKAAYVAAVFAMVRSAGDYGLYYLLTVLMIGANAAVNLWHTRRLVSWTGVSRLRHARRYVRPMLMLGLYSMLTAMYTTFNVSFLGFACGDRQVGYYSTALKFFTILIGFYTALTSVMLPRMSALLTDSRDEDFRRLVRRSSSLLVSVAVPLAIACLMLAPEIVWAIAGEGYEGAVTPLRIMAPLIFVVGYEQILVIQTLMPARCDKLVCRNALIAAMLGIALNIAIVPRAMAAGSATAWAACEACVLVLSQRAVTRRFGVAFPLGEAGRTIAAYLPLALLLAAMRWHIGSPLIRLTAGGALACIYYMTISYPTLRAAFGWEFNDKMCKRFGNKKINS